MTAPKLLTIQDFSKLPPAKKARLSNKRLVDFAQRLIRDLDLMNSTNALSLTNDIKRVVSTIEEVLYTTNRGLTRGNDVLKNQFDGVVSSMNIFIRKVLSKKIGTKVWIKSLDKWGTITDVEYVDRGAIDPKANGYAEEIANKVIHSIRNAYLDGMMSETSEKTLETLSEAASYPSKLLEGFWKYFYDASTIIYTVKVSKWGIFSEEVEVKLFDIYTPEELEVYNNSFETT